MSDTTVQECKNCGHTTDCIQGLCMECRVRDPEDIFLVKVKDCTEHSFTDQVRFFNGSSAWGNKVCQKCGAIYQWQYDFPNVTPGYQETRPY